MIFMNIMANLTFIFLNHPLTMGFILFIQSTLIVLITGSLTMNFWFSYMLFLIMIGGMLILFMYMISIASNEMFKFSMIMLIYTMLSSCILYFLMKLTRNLMFFNETHYLNIKNTLLINNQLFLIKFFNSPMLYLLSLIMIFLFITLIATVKITKINQGPMRQIY